MPAAPENALEDIITTLYPIASQGQRILHYLSRFPVALTLSDTDVSREVGQVSAQQVALVKRALLGSGILGGGKSPAPEELQRLALNLEGVACYLKTHHDKDSVQLVITEPGSLSLLRREIDRRNSPILSVFQTSDAFAELARSAEREFSVLAPFLDDAGTEFLIGLFQRCKRGVSRHLVCRPLAEPQCGAAFSKRRDAFKEMDVAIYEYALPSSLPSGRETFHAKVLIADDAAYYAGSSNFLASGLERSLECGVFVRGQSARHLASVVEALRTIAPRYAYP
jgi:hypothetical protein